MNKLKKIFIVILTLILSHQSSVREAFAVCPVCTIAVGAGLGLSRFIGIDDSITGIWVGGMLVSLSFWTANYLEKKGAKLPQKLIFSFIFWALLTFIPLQISGIIGHPFNTVFGIDKLIFGSSVGIIAFLIAVFADKKVKSVKEKQLFNFQKVVFPLMALIIASIIMFLITSVKITFI